MSAVLLSSPIVPREQGRVMRTNSQLFSCLYRAGVISLS